MCLTVSHVHTYIYTYIERTDKVPLGSIRKVISEPIKGQEEYHIMVSSSLSLLSLPLQLSHQLVNV